MRTVRPLLALLVLCGFAGASAAGTQDSPAGRWDGAISIMGNKLGMVLQLVPDGSGFKAFLDIPQQGSAGLPLTAVRVDGLKVHFELPAGPGLAVFDGERQGDVIKGTFAQAGITGTFEVVRGAAALPAAPAAPPPYKEEEVSIQTPAVKLGGTLTLPQGAGPHPAVVLITGSGAENRDEEVFGFKVFRVLADHLTRNGIAVLRCDDRGVGASSGSVAQSTSSDFADDALAQVAYLRTRPDIDKAHVGLLGHSEGGLIAPIAASRTTDVAFIVLVSGPGLPGAEILLAQSETVGRAAGMTDEQIRNNQAIQRQMFAAARTGTGWDEVAASMKTFLKATLDALPEAQRQSIKDPEALIQKQVDAQLASVRSPWMKFFLEFDPAAALVKVRCPVLATFGGRDVQVPTAPNRAAMEKAFATSKFTHYRIEAFPTANHLYQDAVTGSVAEYTTLKKEFVPGFLDLLTTWIRQQAAPAKK
jgi:uncharacterized protein